jgi:hypothetical protein
MKSSGLLVVIEPTALLTLFAIEVLPLVLEPVLALAFVSTAVFEFVPARFTFTVVLLPASPHPAIANAEMPINAENK